MFYQYINGRNSNFAFVVGNSKLMLVDIETDEIVSVLIDSFFADSDFSIKLKYGGYGQSGYGINLQIMNSGYLYTFYNIPNNASAVNSVKTDASKRAQAYSLEGYEIASPSERIYIQDGKKVLKK
jgi:hypothetical protein